MSKDDLLSLISDLQNTKWQIEVCDTATSALDPAFRVRYPHIPEDYLLFLDHVASGTHLDQTAWFLTVQSYNSNDEAAFRWNEWEEISLNAAQEAHDPDWVKSIETFWDNHLPFLLSVRSEYSYCALVVAEENFGSVVYGCEPEFEEVTICAASFIEFLGFLVEASSGASANSYLRDFI